MRSLNTLAAFVVTGSFLHADVLYTENFDVAGGRPSASSLAGWILDHAVDDAVFGGQLYGGFDPALTTTGSVAFLTDATSDDGTKGPAFNNIVIDDYTSIDFSFNYSNGQFNATGVTDIRLAVEVDNVLYASTTSVAPSAAAIADSLYSLSFNPTAANWLVVTPQSGQVTIGSVATSDLTGTITAAGIVQTNSIPAITTYDNFTITAESVPEPSAVAALCLLFPGLMVYRRHRSKSLV